jgi:hypothetical protein
MAAASHSAQRTMDVDGKDIARFWGAALPDTMGRFNIAPGPPSRQASTAKSGVNEMKLRYWARRALLSVLVMIGAAAAAPASAEDMVWSVRSDFPYQVQVAFYSEWRNWEWPGGGQAFDIDDSETHRYNVTCNPGEKICLGAWVKGDATRYWGVGYSRQHACSACCFICGDGPVPTQVLQE